MKEGDKVKITHYADKGLIGKTCVIVKVHKIIDWDIIYKLRCRNRLVDGWFNRYQIRPIKSLGGSVK